MDAREQHAGEKRVREHLIDPLIRLGLVKPSGMTVAQFKVMQDELCGKLAYMTDLNLQALAEQVRSMPSGKSKDRFPIAAKVLGWAAQIQAPADDASPLFRAVFGGALGKAAMAEDFAPELLAHLRSHRVWPREYDVRQIRERADDARRRLTKMAEAKARGFEPSDADLKLQADRARAMAKCQRIVELVSNEAAQ
ncbi:hypothetical protein K4L04_01245 [Phaeobacter inhibens]|uniref:hypothetical protein n=1 Tax=Phaeobacter inhibens TaxID=221822 RepID=UPI0021A277B2|nr:hypothetical protein [Phaeobacter inhibens]UWR76615.1 hypothetical protein K4L04_01245 [Phaeobacter inhibens]